MADIDAQHEQFREKHLAEVDENTPDYQDGFWDGAYLFADFIKRGA